MNIYIILQLYIHYILKLLVVKS